MPQAAKKSQTESMSWLHTPNPHEKFRTADKVSSEAGVKLFLQSTIPFAMRTTRAPRSAAIAAALLSAAARRSLADGGGAYPHLPCNSAAEPPVTSSECLSNAVPLSSLVAEAAAAASSGGPAVVVPCGTCAIVDYSDGSTVAIPGDGSLLVRGRLHFPSTSDVELIAAAVFVEGYLDMDFLDGGNRVTLSLHGGDGQQWTYYPGEACEWGDDSCAEKSAVGEMPVVVAGGESCHVYFHPVLFS